MKLNKRQLHVISAMKQAGNELYQSTSSYATWYIFHPELFRVRMNLTCKDVNQLVNLGIMSVADKSNKRRLLKV